MISSQYYNQLLYSNKQFRQQYIHEKQDIYYEIYKK